MPLFWFITSHFLRVHDVYIPMFNPSLLSTMLNVTQPNLLMTETLIRPHCANTQIFVNVLILNLPHHVAKALSTAPLVTAHAVGIVTRLDLIPSTRSLHAPPLEAMVRVSTRQTSPVAASCIPCLRSPYVPTQPMGVSQLATGPRTFHRLSMCASPGTWTGRGRPWVLCSNRVRRSACTRTWSCQTVAPRLCTGETSLKARYLYGHLD